MKQRVLKLYHKITDQLKSTSISKTPGIKILHRKILGVIERLSNPVETHQWITYEGSHLYINPRDYVSETLYNTGRYEPSVRDKISESLDDGDMALDIGGHIGHHSITMRNFVGESGVVLIFEPHPKNADNIRRTINKNDWENVELFEKGLSNDEGTQVLVENPTNTGGSSIKKKQTTGSEYEVEIVRLSKILSLKNIDCIKLIKIDIEGGEYEVIKDVKDMLGDIEIMILEIHAGILSNNQLNEIYEILSSKGNIKDIDNESALSISSFSDRDSSFNIIWKRE
jgi:FkbM family methyltransferase